MALITGLGTSSVTQKGTFVQGSSASFILEFYDINGIPYDPTEISISVLDPSNVVLDTIDGISKIDVGEYAVDYYIEASATTGVYTLQYTFISQTTTGPETKIVDENFLVIHSTSSSSQLVETQRMIMRTYLDTLIRTTQRIPVKAEPVIWERGRTRAKLTFGNWNQPAGVRVYRNNNLITTGYEVDYLRGEIEFDHALDAVDKVDVDYNFRWFTEQDIDCFVASGISRTNMYPPVTDYYVGTTPNYWVFVSMWGAAVDAIRTIMLDLIHQQPQIVFGGPEAAQKAIDVLDRVKKNYEEDLKMALELKKFGSYHDLMAMIVVPEYSLPGGRCLSSKSLILFSFLADINSDVYTDTVENVYTFFESGKDIFVLSDNNGSPSYQRIYKIWKSGRKELFRITDDAGNFIDVSKEHIVFVNEKETPAENIVTGDSLTIFDNETIKTSKVISVEKIDEEETYDIEVPSTKNLFVNNIKCHNSRWFRYLFKGS